MSFRHIGIAAAIAAFLGLAPASALATWSIVAVDAATGEVGAAAATCTVGVELILGLVPGKGVIVAQAATNFSARDEGMRLIGEDIEARDVIARIAIEKFNPGGWVKAPWTKQQYGVATTAGGAVAGFFTGADTPEWHGGMLGGGVSAQGNTLRNERVIGAAFAAYHEGRGPMAHRLIAALEAGANEGGDARCDRERAALSAFVAVAQRDDPPGKPTLYLVAPRAFGIMGSIGHAIVPYRPGADELPATSRLREIYESWLIEQN